MDHTCDDFNKLDVFYARDLHFTQQRPYSIVTDDGVGRHMVASRDIKPGEIIFKESPLVFGPSDTSRAVCLGCYRTLDSLDHVCSRCGYPMCRKECQDLSDHKENECLAFYNNGFRLNAKTEVRLKQKDFNLSYAIISPIRAFLKREKDPKTWNMIWSHMSHDKARRESTFWSKRTKDIIDQLKKSIGLKDPEDLRTMEILLGILLVNDFELVNPCGEANEEDSSPIRALFALASMPSHNCIANCTHDFADRSDGFVMTVRSVTKILKGEEITHTYTEPLEPLLQRKSLLSLGKFFECNCKRCSDPTELGTYCSAIKCKKCNSGYYLSTDVNRVSADWKCDKCKAVIKSNEVDAICKAAKEESEALDCSCEATIEDYEDFLKKYSEVLHPSHVILIDRKYVLAKMYGRVSGYLANQLSETSLKRKKLLCQEVLKVLDKLVPGRTRKRGVMMYEMHVPLVMLANKALTEGPNNSLGYSPQDIKNSLKNGLFNLRMGLEILKEEPVNSFEGKIVQGSKDSVRQLEEWIQTISSTL